MAGMVALLIAALVTASPATAAPVLYEAENATIINGLVESNHAGFTGTGFVNAANAVGSAVEFSVQMPAAGSRNLLFRYANASSANRPASLSINGVNHSTVLFAPTGGWTTWISAAVNAVALSNGTNLVRISASTSNGLPNLDSLTVDDGVGGGEQPIEDPIPQNPIASGLGLVLTEYATFPQSQPVPTPTDQRLVRRARINALGEIPGTTGRRFVPDLNGKLYVLPAGGGTPATYLDVRQVVGANFFSGRGLGSGFGFVAFHPEFATNGRFYTVHSEAFSGGLGMPTDWTQTGAVVHSILTEWTATNPAAATFSGTRRPLLRLGFGTYIHAIQQIDFNPNATPGSADYGMLYLAVGEGGRGLNTTQPQARNLPFGKILRIDPRGTNSTNGRYGIPASNPFVGQAGTLGEIYALGMRDPHRFSWDRGGTGRMFLGHIGEHSIESVYDVRAGDNFGWSQREGKWVYRNSDPCNVYTLPANDSTLGFTYPVAAYDHNPPTDWNCSSDLGRAIAGGFVYRGSALPALQGKYFFGDLVQGWVFYTNESAMVRGSATLAPIYQLKIFTSSGTQTSMPTLAGDARVDLRFGTDRAGELYVLSKANGKIWKVTGVQGSAP
ncbi:hypothetical protein Rhe02_31840 [Rhizocola hellebori]|uniref:CBM6 domain-containing protein n=1 Tax=Rhizocola hellebori TaxID=1392758 RepID=A0A8J3Q843_9ACTN|nr:hypothetical protein Rhe02_31840 [Rhizocola hellebori]